MPPQVACVPPFAGSNRRSIPAIETKRDANQYSRGNPVQSCIPIGALLVLSLYSGNVDKVFSSKSKHEPMRLLLIGGSILRKNVGDLSSGVGRGSMDMTLYASKDLQAASHYRSPRMRKRRYFLRNEDCVGSIPSSLASSAVVGQVLSWASSPAIDLCSADWPIASRFS